MPVGRQAHEKGNPWQCLSVQRPGKQLAQQQQESPGWVQGLLLRGWGLLKHAAGQQEGAALLMQEMPHSALALL